MEEQELIQTLECTWTSPATVRISLPSHFALVLDEQSVQYQTICCGSVVGRRVVMTKGSPAEKVPICFVCSKPVALPPTWPTSREVAELTGSWLEPLFAPAATPLEAPILAGELLDFLKAQAALITEERVREKYAAITDRFWDGSTP